MGSGGRLFERQRSMPQKNARLYIASFSPPALFGYFLAAKSNSNESSKDQRTKQNLTISNFSHTTLSHSETCYRSLRQGRDDKKF